MARKKKTPKGKVRAQAAKRDKKTKATRAAGNAKNSRKAKPARKMKRRKRPILQERAQPETFISPSEHFSQQKPESETALLDKLATEPIDVPQIAEAAPSADNKARKSVPHAITSVIAAGVVGAITLFFFMTIMKFPLLYALAVAVPVFVALAIMINGLLEERAR